MIAVDRMIIENNAVGIVQQNRDNDGLSGQEIAKVKALILDCSHWTRPAA